MVNGHSTQTVLRTSIWYHHLWNPPPIRWILLPSVRNVHIAQLGQVRGLDAWEPDAQAVWQGFFFWDLQ